MRQRIVILGYFGYHDSSSVVLLAKLSSQFNNIQKFRTAQNYLRNKILIEVILMHTHVQNDMGEANPDSYYLVCTVLPLILVQAET